MKLFRSLGLLLWSLPISTVSSSFLSVTTKTLASIKNTNPSSTVVPYITQRHRPHLFLVARNADSGSTIKATLSADTTWQLRFVLRGVETHQGKKVDEIFLVRGSFLEEINYEPPQGTFVIQDTTTMPSSRLKFSRTRWQLSEDPNDRKDGLWVWGLFKEPLYPFLLLQLETDAIPLITSTSSKENEDTVKDAIRPLRLFCQLEHKRDSNGSVTLSPTSELKIRQMETVQADIFGAATADIYEEINVGTLSLQPII